VPVETSSNEALDMEGTLSKVCKRRGHGICTCHWVIFFDLLKADICISPNEHHEGIYEEKLLPFAACHKYKILNEEKAAITEKLHDTLSCINDLCNQ
jgi:hypothetical protein